VASAGATAGSDLVETVTIDGVELAYETRGAGEPVVLIHGALIADAFWPLLEEPALVDRYQVITYRRRGYGRTPRSPKPVRPARQAADCRGLLGHLGVERAHVVGHSYGGAVALELATRSPHIVGSLALLEPALMLGSSGDDYRESLRRGMQRYRDEGPAPVVEEMLRVRWGEDPRQALEPVLPGAFDQAVRDAATTFEAEGPPLLEWEMGEAQLRNVRQPALVVLGERSQNLSPRFVETFELLLSWLPNAEGYVLPDAAHGLQLQNPRAMSTALADFFARHPLLGRA
jgi:pimeloyl-ACP methyl ester carboxylesterase